MVFLCQHYANLSGQGMTIGIMGGDEETLFSMIRVCGMGVPPTRALNMSERPHLTIDYLLQRRT